VAQRAPTWKALRRVQVLSGIMESVAHSAERRPVRPSARVALLVNSLGGTPALELGAVAAAAVRIARQRHEVKDLSHTLLFQEQDAHVPCVVPMRMQAAVVHISVLAPTNEQRTARASALSFQVWLGAVA